MIELANTEEKFKECVEFLAAKGIFPLKGTSLFFARTGKLVKAVAGWNPDTGGTIDPFFCEDPHHVKDLYNVLKGIIIARGFGHIQILTNNEKIVQRLINEEDFRVWNPSVKCLIKEL